MTLYEKLIEDVENGKGFKIDLKFKYLRIGRKTYIKGGEIKDEIDLIKNDCSWQEVKELWDNFQRSVPNTNYKNHYFKGVDVEELEDFELVQNDSRYLAQAKLEGYLLLANLKGVLKWEQDDKYFYQDGDMFILREWF